VRLLAALVPIYLATLALTPAPVHAATVTLSPAAGPPGSTVTLTGQGFRRATRVLVRAGQRTRTARVDRRGAFAASLAIPATRRHTLAVRSSARGQRVVNVFRIGAAASAAGEVASTSGARVRWSPLEGRPGDSLTLGLTRFPQRRDVLVSFGSTRIAAGRTSRRGNVTVRLKLPAISPGRTAVAVRVARRLLRFGFLVRPSSSGVPASSVSVPEPPLITAARSEERRVGKECRSRWSPYH